MELDTGQELADDDPHMQPARGHIEVRETLSAITSL